MAKRSKIENMKILEEFQDDSSDSEVDDTIGEIVPINFEGFTAEEDDFHGIQRLLSQGFRGLDINLSDLANILIKQNYVGSVIKEVIDDEKQAMDVDEDALDGEPDEEGDFIFGLNTIVNISHSKKQSEYMAGVRSALLARCEASDCSDESKETFRAALGSDTQHVGLLINERLVNLPVQISIPAFKTLIEEMEQANAIQMPFKFKYILLIAKLYKISKLKSKKAVKAGKSVAEAKQAKEVYANCEEEVLAEFATSTFEYCVQDCSSLTAESWNDHEADQKRVKPYRRILLVPAEKLLEALEKIEKIIEDNP